MRRLATEDACEYWLQCACRALLLLAFCTLAPPALATTPCLGNPDALGTERVLVVDPSTPRVGRKHFPQTLSLSDKEVVLTFDDGPRPGTTPRVLDILKRECVRATFFLIGGNAAAQQTTRMLPSFLRELKRGGYRGVHIVPSVPPPESTASSAGMDIVGSDQQTPPVRAAEDKPGGEAPDGR